MCIVCERIKAIKENKNPYFVKELETGYVVLGDHQHFKGYTLFLYRDHVKEAYDLEADIRARHLNEMITVARAVANTFNADKMNYESLGNGASHLHWHIFPRRAGDIEDYGNNGKGPVWWYPREMMYDENNRPSESELEKMKQLLLSELNKLF